VAQQSGRLIGRGSTTFVKKKAALTLLRLYRKHPSVMPLEDWAERIVDMIEDRDPGVSMTAVTLVTTMAQDNLDAFQGCYKRVVEKMDKLIFDGDYPSEYVYYKVGSLCLIAGGHAETIGPESLVADQDTTITSVLSSSRSVPLT
jgi:hypothetical protein